MPPVLLPRPRHAFWSGALVDSSPSTISIGGSLPPQGYRLAIRHDEVEITAADAAGAFYAQATLEQLRRGAPVGRLPEGVVEDWPDIAVRGVLLDVSRDKVPTVDTLEALIDRLASWKVNHVQLYMEHTFAYGGHDVVWADASPFTPADIVRLDRFCRDRHVELTPNQNGLGHFERWLRHEPYRSMAITPDGWIDGRGRHRPPTTLEPTDPRTLELVSSLLAELSSSFSSRRVHVGLDEPWELPDERFDDYLSYVRALRSRPELDGRQMLMWGDIVASHPEQLVDLPDGVTVCEWGYEASSPFAERAALLAASGRPFWLCPGTSSWNSLVGRTTNMIENCRAAAEVALDTGAEGYLVTDWGDNGHLQYLPASEPGFAFAAGVSWCASTNGDMDLSKVLSTHAFDDETGELAHSLLALGDAHRLVEPQVPNASVLVLQLLSPRFRMGEGYTAGLTADDLDRVGGAIADARARLSRSRPGRADGALVVAELDASARLLDLLVDDAQARLLGGGTIEAVPESTRAVLAAELDELMAEHRELWLARNRPGGLDDSCGRLSALAAVYRN